MQNNDTYRILADNIFINNNTRKTQLNNNDLIIGPSGAGKTRNYVIPNILQANESLVIADTKGNLIKEYGPYLKRKGYNVMHLDFKNPKNSTHGYNPLYFIRFDKDDNAYNEKDIFSISQVIAPVQNKRDPFWDQASQMYFQCLVSYCLECLPVEEVNLVSVAQLVDMIGSKELDEMFGELERVNEDLFAVRKYKQMVRNRTAEKMEASIKGILYSHMNPFSNNTIEPMFSNPDQVDFKKLGQEKTVLFLSISDTDRCMDKLLNILYTQAFQELCDYADNHCEEYRLPVPVRFILDDFATNTVIPNFDKLISVIRSREIYVSLIVQSLTQLENLYDRMACRTIENNCDTWLYLGGQDYETACMIGRKADKLEKSILNMPLDQAILFHRGSEPKFVEKFKLESHEMYNLTSKGEESAYGNFY